MFALLSRVKLPSSLTTPTLAAFSPRFPTAGKLLEGVQEAEAALAPWMPPARLAQLSERRKQLGSLLAQLQAGLLRPSGGESHQPAGGLHLECHCRAQAVALQRHAQARLVYAPLPARLFLLPRWI